MSGNGRIVASNGRKLVPNLNRYQKGVPGLQNALARSDGKDPVNTTRTGGGILVYMYFGSKESGSSVAISSHLNPKNGEVDYRWIDRSNPSSPILTIATDKDNDGNIDMYTTTKFDRYGKTISEKTYVNPNDDGNANFQIKQNESKGFSWNPLNWFK